MTAPTLEDALFIGNAMVSNCIHIVIAIIVCGLLLWLAEANTPMDPTIKTVLRGVVIIVLILWLLNVFGVLGYMSNVNVRPIR